jgi:hypothetical protein
MPQLKLNVPKQIRKLCVCGQPKKYGQFECWQCRAAEQERLEALPTPEIVEEMYPEDVAERVRYMQALGVLEWAAKKYSQVVLARQRTGDAQAHIEGINEALEVIHAHRTDADSALYRTDPGEAGHTGVQDQGT